LSHRSDAEAASVEDLKSREAALLREYQAKQADLERRAREVEGKERAFAKETASLQELKGKLEQQEMDLLVKIREFGPREETVAKADATLARETAKLHAGPGRETRGDEAAGRVRSGRGEGDPRGPRPPRGETQGGRGTGPEGRCRLGTSEEAARAHQRRSQEDSVRDGR